MAALVFRILGRAVLTLLLLTACVFFVLHLTGDPARLMLGSDASAEAIAAFVINGGWISLCGNSSESIF